MKKILLVVAMLFMFFIVSCANKEIKEKTEENIVRQETEKDIVDQSQEQKAAENNVVFKELETVDLDESAVSLKKMIEDDIDSVKYFDREKIIYFKDKQSELSVDLADMQVYLYDRKTGESKYLLEVPNVNNSKEDICFCKNKVYFTFGQVSTDQHYNSLLEVDVEQAAAQLIPIEGSNVPLVDIAVTDEDVFILKKNVLNGNQTDSIIDRLDGQKFTEIAKTSYITGDSEEDENEGELFLDIKGEGELLYAYKEGVTFKGFFLCMTREGEVKEKYELDLKEYLKLDMEEFDGLQEDGEEEEIDYSWEIGIRGDYFMIETLNCRILMFKKENDKFIPIDVPEKLNDKKLKETANPIKDFENGRYLFFHAYEEQSMYIFDTQTEKFGRVNINSDSEVELIMKNENNQFIFRIYKNDDTRDFLFYEKEGGWEL